MIGADSTSPVALFDMFNGTGTWEFRHAATTAAAPSQTLANTMVMQLATRTYTNTPGYGTQNVRIRGYAAENQTATAQGASLQMWSTPNGTLVPTNPTLILQGGMQLGAPTGGDKGIGTLNATGVYANNVLLTSDASLKRDITTLPDDCLALVAAIEPKQFRFIEPPLPLPVDPDDDGTPMPMWPTGWYDRVRWGFVAQDVEAAMQSHDFGGVEFDDNDLRSLSLPDMVAVLWKAVQELRAELRTIRGD
jgi:hypothetical protein